MKLKIISGGQTGVDRAALDVAIELGIPHGGWCPLGRRAEDGVIPARYDLTETTREDYRDRTLLNIREADATLILTFGRELTGGTLFTATKCRANALFVVDIQTIVDPYRTKFWLDRIPDLFGAVLNVAGPRESKCPGIHEAAKKFLRSVLT